MKHVVGWALAATLPAMVATAMAQPLGTLVDYLTDPVKVYDDNWAPQGRRAKTDMPPPGAPVLAIDSSMIQLQGKDKPLWVDKTSVRISSDGSVKLPICPNVKQVAKASDTSTAGVRGLDSNAQLCQSLGARK